MMGNRKFIFWIASALAGATTFAVENLLFDLSGYLCFSGLIMWSALAARRLT